MPPARFANSAAAGTLAATMLHYFKFRQELFGPQPARDVYVKSGAGKGWPEECPPIRAANAFGFDLLANFDVTFVKGRNGWRVEDDVVIDSDFHYAGDEESDGKPLSQQYAWFWEKRQKLPHVITDNVYAHISNQVKLSSFLFLRTDPNELLYMTDLPNMDRPWRAMTALVDTDWYPASYPWHTVIELSRGEKRIAIRKGDPLCRVIPVRRDTYFARPMTPGEFDDFFARGQRWLETHGKPPEEPKKKKTKAVAPEPGTLDITRTYTRQQLRSRFTVVT